MLEGLARRVLVEVGYAIGLTRPVSLRVDSFQTGKMPDERLSRLVGERFDFRPLAIVELLQLERPIYTPTSSYGHFGRNEFPWEEGRASLE